MEEKNNQKQVGKKLLFMAGGIVIGILLAGAIAFSLIKKNETKADELTQQINALIEEKNALGEKIADLEKTKTELGTQTETLEKEIEIIETEKAALEVQIETLTEELKTKSVDNTQISVLYSDGAKTIKAVTVNKGGSVKASDIPAVPSKTGYTGTWSNNGKNVQGNLVIYPVYVPQTYSIHYLLGNYTSRSIKEYYKNTEGDCELRAISVGSQIMMEMERRYNISAEGVFEYAGKSYRVEDRTAEDCNVYDADDNYVGSLSWGQITLYTPSASFVLDNVNNKVLEGISSYIMPIEGGVFEVGSLHYCLDRVAGTVKLLETGETMATLDGYEYDHWYYKLATEQFLDLWNEYAVFTGYTFDGKYFVVEDVSYIFDFNNLNVYYLQTDDVIEWIDPSDVLPASYTYGEDIVLDLSREYVTAPPAYSFYGAYYLPFSDHYILNYISLYDGMMIENPLGDITIVIILMHNPN